MKRLIVFILSLYTSHAMAFNWLDLWLQPDQQGARLLQQGKPAQAAQRFTDKQWQGIAHFRAGHYTQAANQFQQLSSADAHYNRGNALALQGDYSRAITAYEQALQLQPEHADAKYNLEIIKKLMQHKNQQQNNNNPSENDSKNNNGQSDEAQDNKQQSDKAAKNTSTTSHKNVPKNEPKPTGHEAQKNTNKQNASAKRSKASTGKESVKQTEIQQANEQWLQQIPDDPGGLLRQKFLRDYQQRHAH